MQNYDQYKLDNPFESEEDGSNCNYCKSAIEQETNYCSINCEENDN